MNFEIDSWFIAFIVAFIIEGVYIIFTIIHHRLQVHRGTIKSGIRPFVDCPCSEKIPISGGGYVPSIRYIGKELLTRDLPHLVNEGVGFLPKCSHCEKQCSMQYITTMEAWRHWQYGIGLYPPLQIRDAN